MKDIFKTIKKIRKKVQCAEFNDEEACNFLIQRGIKLDDRWVCIDEREVDYEKEDEYDARVKVSFAVPDNEEYVVLYKYSPTKTSYNSRSFCINMVSADLEYKKEDIIAMDSNALNPGLGHNGGSYSIWLYKGGVACHHKWFRKTYQRILDDNGNIISENPISTGKARKNGFYDTPNPSEVSVAPIDMPNMGHYPGVK
jgi:hypothetical protein